MREVDQSNLDPQLLAALTGISVGRASELLGEDTELETARLRAPKVTAERIAGRLTAIDVNRVTVDQLQTLGLSRESARRVCEGGPYWFVEDALQAVGAVDSEVRNRLQVALDVPRLILGPGRELTPVPGSLLVRVDETEGGAVLDQLGRMDAEVHRDSLRPGEYVRVDVPQTEGAVPTVRDMRGVDLVVPVFEDWEGVIRSIDPRFLNVQLEAGANQVQAEEALAALDIEVAERLQTPGLWLVRLPRFSGLDTVSHLLAAVAAMPGVDIVEPAWLPDDDLETDTSPSSSPVPPVVPWNLAMIGLPRVWGRARGQGVEVIVIDTGVDLDHPALAGAMVERGADEDWDFTGPGVVPEDERGHGTAVASVIAANGHGGLLGVAPDSRVVALRIPVTGSLESYARRRDALLYAAQRATTRRVVVNCSWKTTGDVALIRDAVEKLSQAGAVVVASAGNGPDRADQPHYPSDYASVISVAALHSSGQRAPYSFYGSGVDLAAPGGDGPHGDHQVRAAALGGSSSDEYGTSMAAPHVAGSVAVLWSALGVAAPASAVRDAIESSARVTADTGIGRGALDLDAAVPGQEEPGQPSPPDHRQQAIRAANTLPLEVLVEDIGLPRFTARLIVARRPLADFAALEGTIGVEVEHIDRLAASGQVESAPRCASG